MTRKELAMRESSLTRRLLARLRQRGHYAIKIVGSPQQQRGLPDLVACVDGTFVGIEVKRPGRKATPGQARELERIGLAGGRAAVVTSLAELEELLTELEGAETPAAAEVADLAETPAPAETPRRVLRWAPPPWPLERWL